MYTCHRCHLENRADECFIPYRGQRPLQVPETVTVCENQKKMNLLSECSHLSPQSEKYFPAYLFIMLTATSILPLSLLKPYYQSSETKCAICPLRYFRIGKL
ncbi:hypothetical protein CEXT_535941 [Caerostris extrusa]|uniref:Uncharacterized protein n=1 Tax=Caerostris extrusa TaxID=172846 RepID=A0AAV4QHM8_CAEEX|nr:hypothetical protein CEXT_535941 [Caerostris extrusa]